MRSSSTSIRTTGDRVQNRLLAEIGGKGLFTKEIEEALLDRRIDLAVHSLKDMETVLPAGLEIACVLPRDDPRDALVSRDGGGLPTLPRGRRIGTASLRRRAQLLRRRGRSRRRCRSAAMSTPGSPSSPPARSTALVLALCGLRAPRQGRVGERDPLARGDAAGGRPGRAGDRVPRADDAACASCWRRSHDAASAACVTAERAMLAALDGSCRTPIAGLADDRRRSA